MGNDSAELTVHRAGTSPLLVIGGNPTAEEVAAIVMALATRRVSAATSRAAHGRPARWRAARASTYRSPTAWDS